MFVIEKDIPITKARTGNPGGPRTSKYPWAIMEVGDSFFVEAVDQKVAAARVQSSWQSARKLHFGDRKMKVRRTTEERNGETLTGLRVWRVA